MSLARVSDVLAAVDPDLAVFLAKFPDRMSTAAAKGTALHEVLASIVTMTPCQVTGEDEPYAEAFSAWWDERTAEGWEPVLNEERIESAALGWHGQPDLVCRDAAKQLVVVDFKRTAKLGWRYHLQLAAYCALVADKFGEPCQARKILQFHDGAMKQVDLPAPNVATDIMHFRYALAIYRYKSAF